MTTQILGFEHIVLFKNQKYFWTKRFRSRPSFRNFAWNYCIFQHWVLKKFLNLSGYSCGTPSSETYRNDEIG